MTEGEVQRTRLSCRVLAESATKQYSIGPTTLSYAVLRLINDDTSANAASKADEVNPAFKPDVPAYEATQRSEGVATRAGAQVAPMRKANTSSWTKPQQCTRRAHGKSLQNLLGPRCIEHQTLQQQGCARMPGVLGESSLCIPSVAQKAKGPGSVAKIRL